MRVALGLCFMVTIPFFFHKERKVQGGNSVRGKAGNEFNFLLSGFGRGSRSGVW